MKEKCFQIRQITAGWIEGIIRSEQTTILFRYSYLRNFPDDLMCALLTVLGGYPAEEHRDVFRAEAEPAVAEWKLSSEGENLRIQVRFFADKKSDVVCSQKTAVLNKDAFLRDFVSETDALLRRFGLLGYRLEWASEFPLSLYLKIRDIASGQCKLSVSALPEEENCGMVAQCSDFAAECSNLNEINR